MAAGRDKPRLASPSPTLFPSRRASWGHGALRGHHRAEDSLFARPATVGHAAGAGPSRFGHANAITTEPNDSFRKIGLPPKDLIRFELRRDSLWDGELDREKYVVAPGREQPALPKRSRCD